MLLRLGGKVTQTLQNQPQPPAHLQAHPPIRLNPHIFLTPPALHAPEPARPRLFRNTSEHLLSPPLLPSYRPLSYPLKVSKVSGLPSSLTIGRFPQGFRVIFLTGTSPAPPHTHNPLNSLHGPKSGGSCLAPPPRLSFLCELLLGQPNTCHLPLCSHPLLRSTAAFCTVTINCVLAILLPILSPQVQPGWLVAWASVFSPGYTASLLVYLGFTGSGCHGGGVAEGGPGGC